MNDEKDRKADAPDPRPRLGRAMAALMGGPPEPVAAPVSEPAGDESEDAAASQDQPGQPGEHGGPKGPEPTRYGDWERKGRCIDF